MATTKTTTKTAKTAQATGDGVFPAPKRGGVFAGAPGFAPGFENAPQYKPPKQTEAQIRFRILKQKEVDANSAIFRELYLSKLLKKHRDKFALLKGGEVVGIFPDFLQASEEGGKRYADGFYSVQKITDKPLSLGFFSG